MKKLFFTVCLLAILTVSAQTPQDKDVSLEVSLALNSSGVVVPGLLANTINSIEGGTGYDLGLGITTRKDIFEFRASLSMWSYPFHSNIRADENNDRTYIEEEASLTYIGPQLRFSWGKNVFFGFGLDFSVYSNFSGSRKYYENGRLIGAEDNIESSALSQDLKQSVRLSFDLGGRIPIGQSLFLKPFIGMAIPLSPIYPKQQFTDIVNTPYMRVYYEEPVEVGIYYVPVFTYGLRMELF